MPHTYIDAEFLQRIERLDFKPYGYARGWLPGKHRSPFRGTSVEFADHRAYTPGDDLRQLDWRVYARQERYAIRQHEGEVRSSVHLMLDTSSSMNYGVPSKFAFAARTALGLAYLVLKQQDAVSLWHHGESALVPLASGMAQFHRIVKAIGELTTEGRHKTTKALQDASHRVPRHGIWLIFSDCLEPIEHLRIAIQQIRFQGHEAALWHILHPDEKEMQLTGPTEFIGYEGGRIRIQADQFRNAYRTHVQEFCQELRSICHQESIDYVAPDISLRAISVLTEHLTRRLSHRPSS